MEEEEGVVAEAEAVAAAEEEAVEVEVEVVIRINFLLRLQLTPIKVVFSRKVGVALIQTVINGEVLYSLQGRIPISRKFPSIQRTANQITRFNGQSIIEVWV